MKTELKTRPYLKAVFNLFETRMQIFLICILIKQQKHVAINNYLITHFTKQTLSLNYLLLTLNVTVQLLNYPKQKSPFFFLNFKFSLNGGDLVFWFTFNLAVDLRPKMALTLEILSDQMHTLPRNSAEQTLFLFASFRRSKSALRHLLCEATCSLRTDKQLGNNVTSVDEYSTIVTVQQLGARIMHIMHISRVKYNS